MRSLSIVIPAFNEEQRLPASLDAVLDFVNRRDFESIEVIVVDDGSRDGTAAAVRGYAATHPAVKLLQNPGNRGKGFAVRHGMLAATGEWALITDADLSAPIAELDKLFAAAERERAQVAIGSRALNRALVEVHQSPAREYAGRAFNVLMRAITGLPFQDTQCGFKLFHSSTLKPVFGRVKLEGFGFDVEALFIAKQLGFRIVEVPVRWSNVEGTKVSLWKGLDSFGDPLRIRRNHMRGDYR